VVLGRLGTAGQASEKFVHIREDGGDGFMREMGYMACDVGIVNLDFSICILENTGTGNKFWI
jgi:hypothetical protein